MSSPPDFSGVRVTWSLVLCACFVDRCLFFCSFFVWSLCCLFSLDILITPLVSSNSSYTSVFLPSISSILLGNHHTQCWEYYYQPSALKKKSELSTIDHLNKMRLKGPKEQSESKKNKQHNGHNKKEQRSNDDLQNIHIKLKIESHEPH